MTVVPDEHLMTLICDTCGETIRGTACVLPDAEVVWTLVAEHGWSGSPFATGPHRCPHCSLLPASTGGHASCDDHGPGGILGIDHLDGTTVIAATGDIDLDTGDNLRTALRHVAEVGGHVVVDLSRVHIIDSTGLGLLVRAHREARERGVTLCLAAPSRFIRTVLHTMRLDGAFPIFDSRDDALAQLSDGGARTLPEGHAVAVPR
ncbi:STAS domain-containing protein [Micromonospora ureilytica]|uniref:Anti-sigma factor antagonist n=1 Tax=Micromonospora ureilytica TaxID=709868 RepID=A0ABS0JDN2_9ACTN|nr:STAS domain-containing protein [Micromonospora ureilytica]MBG6065071.1 anti-anti-sigma factor [Micromonospora ureilytica]WSR55304.1 STAS domain-containing protein [Micromonospora ureilytica]